MAAAIAVAANPTANGNFGVLNHTPRSVTDCLLSTSLARQFVESRRCTPASPSTFQTGSRNAPNLQTRQSRLACGDPIGGQSGLDRRKWRSRDKGGERKVRRTLSLVPISGSVRRIGARSTPSRLESAGLPLSPCQVPRSTRPARGHGNCARSKGQRSGPLAHVQGLR